MNTARCYFAGFGTQTAAIAAGSGPPAIATVESYDGTNWTAVNSMNTARMSLAGCGTTTAGLVFGGAPASTDTENWDGTSWSTKPSLATGRQLLGGSGTSTAGLGFGGRNPSFTGATEEFTGETITGNVKTFSTS